MRSMVELHNYQEDLLDQVEAALDNDPKARVMMQLPTGGGKTEIAGQLLKRRLTDGRKAVWVTHRRELTEQTCNRLIRADVPAKVEKSWNTDIPAAPVVPDGVTILMDRTLANRTADNYVWSRYGSDDLMIVDEAHHAPAAGWERIMEQWPGQVVGMTATPWRLSTKEGFDHLFGKLICGPQVADLQTDGYLCKARVIAPPYEYRILGGELGWDGDYKPGDIALANSGRRDVMTARALKFWQEHAGDRKKSIVYAVSVNHARNLKVLFDDEGILSGIVLGSTVQKQAERNRAIDEFRYGNLQVLVNVAVVTEGFDVPEASCIVITRPTLSLALYMQMVGRGLRSKDDGGNCLILDLADNTSRHEFPDTPREWKLEPRGNQPSGEAPVTWCPNCYAESHAASHHCGHCGYPLGQECSRCKWRPSRRWQREDCDYPHDLVCDLCHADAHVRAHLPVTEDLIVPKENLLPEERPHVTLFENGRYWHLLSSETVSNGFTPRMLRTPDCGEHSFWPTSWRGKKSRLDGRTGAIGVQIDSWRNLLLAVAEWLIQIERFPTELIPIRMGRSRHLVYTEPKHADGTLFEYEEKLSNGLYLYIPSGSKEICKAVERLNRMSPPDEQFYVQYAPYRDVNGRTGRLERCDHPCPERCDHPRY